MSALAHDSFDDDGHAGPKADHVLVGPPYNDGNWCGELLKDEMRWRFGVPPAGGFKNLTSEIPRVSPA